MPLRRFLFAVIVAFAITAHAAELRIGLAADVTSLDPHYLNVAPNNNAAWHVFDALVHVDANARLVPGLAVSWRAIDPTTWEFKLTTWSPSVFMRTSSFRTQRSVTPIF